MAYPNFPVDTKNSWQQPLDDLVVDQWPNGSSRGRSYFTTGRFHWQLFHGVLSDANRITLQAYYDANKLLLFDYVSPWDGVTYHNVGFIPAQADKPVVYDHLPGLYWNVTTRLRQFL